MKKILTILFVSMLTMGYAVHSSASSSVEIIELAGNSISVTVKGSALHVCGASGQMLYVYNVAGVRVKSVRIDGEDKLVSLNLPKGCYIVKVGDMVRKISIS